MKIIEYFNQKNSILRRSAFALLLNIPPSLIALLLNYFATRFSSQFGLFYLSISTINIIFSGSLILNLLITQLCLTKSKNFEFDLNEYREILSKIISFSMVIFLFLIPLSYFFKILFDLSYMLIISIFFSSIVSYIAEMGRVYLQCKDNFFFAGIYNVAWSFTRATITLIVLYYSKKIWLSIFFYGISSLIPFFYIYLTKVKYLKIRLNLFSKISLNELLNFLKRHKFKFEFLSAYICFSIFNFSELFNTYLYFDELSLNILSASLIVPKGIIIFSIPLVHIFYVTLIKQKKNKVYNFFKGFIFIIFFTLSISIFFKVTSPFYCGNDLGISICNKEYLFLAIDSAILLIIFRSFLVYLDEMNNSFSIFFFPIAIIIYFLYGKFNISNIVEVLELQFNFMILLVSICLLKNIFKLKI